MSRDVSNSLIVPSPAPNVTDKPNIVKSNKVGSFLSKLFIPFVALSTMVIAMSLNDLTNKVKDTSVLAIQTAGIVSQNKQEQAILNMQLFSNEELVAKQLETQQKQMLIQQHQIQRQSDLLKELEIMVLNQKIELTVLTKKLKEQSKVS